MATTGNNVPTWGTAVQGLVSSTELRSEWTKNQLWTGQALVKGKAIPTITADMIAMGNMRSGGTNMRIRYSIETDRLENTIQVNAQAAPAVGANQTLTIAPGTYNNLGESKTYVGAHVIYPGNYTGRIISATKASGNDVFVVQPEGSPSLPAVSQGQYLQLASPSVGEANVPVTRYYHTDVYAYRHGYQVIQHATKLTDFKVAFDQNGKIKVLSPTQMLPSLLAGGEVMTWFSRELEGFSQSIDDQFDTTLVRGRPRATSGASSLSTGENVMGIYPSLQSGALQFVTPSGNYTEADINLMVSGFNAAGYGATRHRMQLGLNVYNKMNNYLLSLGQQDNRQGVGNEYYNFSYKGLKGVGGHEFDYTYMPQFSDSRTGYQQQGFEDIGFIIPDATTADTITGETVPLLSMYWEDAWEGMTNGIGSGMWKWTYQAGPSFVPNGGTVTTPNMEDTLIMSKKACIQTVFHQMQQFGLIE